MEGENFDFLNNNNNNANGYANNPNGHYSNNNSYNNTNNDYNNNNGYGSTQVYDNNDNGYHNTHNYTDTSNINGYDDSNMNQAPQPGDVLMDLIYTIPDFQFTTSLFDDQNDSILFSTLPESSTNNTQYIYGEGYHDIFQALDVMAQPSNLVEPNTQNFIEPTTTSLYFDTQLIPSSESAPSPEERSMYAVSPNNSIMNIEYDIPDSESSSSSSSPKQKKRYYCDLCPGHFGRIQDLNRHLTSIHSNKKEFICEHCHKEFSRRDSLKRHQKTERKKK